jgi:hypothetical protein
LNTNQNDNKEKTGNKKDREEYGYGYDRSVDDLNVIGQNKAAKKNNNNLHKK